MSIAEVLSVLVTVRLAKVGLEVVDRSWSIPSIKPRVASVSEFAPIVSEVSIVNVPFTSRLVPTEAKLGRVSMAASIAASVVASKASTFCRVRVPAASEKGVDRPIVIDANVGLDEVVSCWSRSLAKSRAVAPIETASIVSDVLHVTVPFTSRLVPTEAKLGRVSMAASIAASVVASKASTFCRVRVPAASANGTDAPMVTEANVGDELVAMSCGVERVMVPSPSSATLIWLAVPPTRPTVQYRLVVPCAISSASSTTTPTCPLTESTAPPPPPVAARVPETNVRPAPMVTSMTCSSMMPRSVSDVSASKKTEPLTRVEPPVACRTRSGVASEFTSSRVKMFWPLMLVMTVESLSLNSAWPEPLMRSCGFQIGRLCLLVNTASKSSASSGSGSSLSPIAS